MAITVEEFRQNLETKLSKELVEKIITKYENFDFTNANTDNGNKLSEIDKISTDNAGTVDINDLNSFIRDELIDDFLIARGAYISTYNADDATQIKVFKESATIMKKSMFTNTRPNSITLKSADLLERSQTDESMHLFTLNVKADSILSVVKALYEDLKKYEIPFDIEIPTNTVINNGYTEAIKLHVTTFDFKPTLNAINRLGKVYKDKIQAPNMFNANVSNLIGYDSYIDINGTRTSDVLGSAIIKGLDNTLLELSKEDTFDDQTSVDYLKNSDNKDIARQRILQKVKEKQANIAEVVFNNTTRIIEEEKMPLDVENIFASDLAQSELNAEFGILELREELEETQDRVRITDRIQATASQFKAGIEGLKELTRDSAIQAAVTFGNDSLQKIEEEAKAINNADSLKTDNPTVTVIPKQDKVELTDYQEQSFDKIDEEIKPVVTADAVQSIEDNSMLLPGEDMFTAPVVMPTAPVAQPIIVNEVPEQPKEEVELPNEITIENENNIQMLETPTVEPADMLLPGEEKAVEKPKSLTEIVDHLSKLDLGLNKTPAAPVAPVPAPVVETPAPEVTPIVASAPVAPVVEVSPVFVAPTETPVIETTPVAPVVEDVKPVDLPQALENIPDHEPVVDIMSLEKNIESQIEPVVPVETTGIKEVITPNLETGNKFDIPAELPQVPPVQTELVPPKEELSMEEILEGKEEPAYVGEPKAIEEVSVPTDQGVTIEDDRKIEVNDSKDESVVPEPTFEPVETQAPVIPDDTNVQALDKTQVLTPVKTVDETTKIVDELAKNVDDKTIEIDLPEDEKNLFDALYSELDQTPSKLNLTSKEAISLLTEKKPQDLAIIGKYNYMGLEPEKFSTIIKDRDGNPVLKSDGTPKTFLDYLEDPENQKALAKIDFNGKINLRDKTNRDYDDGKTFAREKIFENSVNGNRSVESIIERYIEEPEVRKKILGIF